MLARLRGDGDFDGWVRGGESSEVGAKVFTAVVSLVIADEVQFAWHELHAPAAARPIAVMEIEALALKDECANAILREVSI